MGVSYERVTPDNSFKRTALTGRRLTRTDCSYFAAAGNAGNLPMSRASC